MPSLYKSLALLCGLSLVTTPAVAAEWQPDGPIRLLIGFGAGGGTDTQARALVTELSEKEGWDIVPQNVPGAGGAVMAAQLKDEPADGLTLGLALNTTFTFPTPSNAGFGLEDFTFLTTTAASQTGVLARTDSGWTSLQDMVDAAKAGTRIVWTNYDPLTQLASDVIADHYGIAVNNVMGSGGRSGVDSLVAQDANVAWGGGAQQALVEAGVLTILASAENAPLAQAPDQPTLEDLGMDYNFGFKFVLAAPAGLPEEARTAITDAVAEILDDPQSETAQFIQRQYPPAPVVVSGTALEDELSADRKSFEALQAKFKAN